MSSPFRFGLLPSLTDVIFIVLLAAFSFGNLAPRLLWDADIGWHIRDGQNILATHDIPHTDSFSATMSGQPWYAWEWLYDASVGWIYNHTGLNGVVFASAAVIAATLALVFRFTLVSGADIVLTTVLFVLVAMTSSIHFLARPHVVGWLLAFLWFWIVETYRRDMRVWRLFLLPPLMLLWANVHGGFVLGFVLLAIYLFADVVIFVLMPAAQRVRAEPKRIYPLAVVGCLSFLASLINPYGIKLHTHVYRYLTDKFLMQHINEFRSPDLHGGPAQAFLLMIALSAVAVFVARKRLPLVHWLLIGFSIFSGAYAARNLPFASMLLMIVVGPLLSLQKFGPGLLFRLKQWRERELSVRLSLWPGLSIIFGVLVCARGGRILGKQVMNAHFDAARLPVQAAAALQERGIHDPIFSLDSWGGYFIYRLYPETRVFVDDRHDFYGDAYIREYLNVLHVQDGWQQVLQAWKVKLVVMPPESHLARALRDSPQWEIVYRDATAMILRRRA